VVVEVQPQAPEAVAVVIGQQVVDRADLRRKRRYRYPDRAVLRHIVWGRLPRIHIFGAVSSSEPRG
jgi:hypothetical protein